MDMYDYELRELPMNQDPVEELVCMSSSELCSIVLEREPYIVDGLLKKGLAVLAGSPKVGKSWLVLQLCMQIARGEPFWGLKTRGGDVLYIALEDSAERLQRRLMTITEEASDRLQLCLGCSALGDELERELGSYSRSHPDLRLVVIDTFQMIRGKVAQMSYANDYSEVSRLKSLADSLKICILLVHHTRKLGDTDSFNEISGTNGIAGSADTLMVLKKPKRASRSATLTCTGRDIGDRELKLEMEPDTCLWKCVSSTDDMGAKPLAPELTELLEYIKRVRYFDDTHAVFKEQLEAFTGHPVDIRVLKRYMNLDRFRLEDEGVYFNDRKIGNSRGVTIIYKEPADRPQNVDVR